MVPMLKPGGPEQLHPKANAQEELSPTQHLLMEMIDPPFLAQVLHALPERAHTRKDDVRRVLSLTWLPSDRGTAFDGFESIDDGAEIPQFRVYDCDGRFHRIKTTSIYARSAGTTMGASDCRHLRQTAFCSSGEAFVLARNSRMRSLFQISCNEDS